MRNRRRAGALALMCVMMLSCGAGAQDIADRAAARRTPVVEVFESNRDCVVNISSTEIVEVRNPFGFNGFFDDFFDMPGMAPPGGSRQMKRTSVGSGFVIHEDGYIVTNAHVVARTTERSVTFADGRAFEAELIALDAERDVAMLKITCDSPLKTVRLGRSNDLMIGETVIAVGNPLGYQNTVTGGIISAVDRDLEFRSDLRLRGLIQTDTSINPGNSGGPLFNILGELIGVNTAIRGDAQNIGFAIPVDQLRDVMPELLDLERRYRFILGIALAQQTVEPRVAAIAPDTPASSVDIRPGDVITAVNGRAVPESVDYFIALVGRKPGDTVTLDLKRDEQIVHVKVALALKPAPDGAALARQHLGITVSAVPAEIAQRLRLPGGSGLLVSEIEDNGPGAQLGLQPYDILVAIGRHNVPTIDDLGQLLETMKSGATVQVTILRAERGRKIQATGRVQLR